MNSGAQASALDAQNIQFFTCNESRWVSIAVHPLQNNWPKVLRCEALVHDPRSVKNSGALAEKCYVIKAFFAIGQDRREIELSLTN